MRIELDPITFVLRVKQFLTLIIMVNKLIVYSTVLSNMFCTSRINLGLNKVRAKLLYRAHFRSVSMPLIDVCLVGIKR